jgi:SAM-dependent methyltransferase
MSTDSPSLFDTTLIARRRDRADALGFQGEGDFLHRAVAEIFAERLADVTRSFDEAVVIGTGGGVIGHAIEARVAELRQFELSQARSRTTGIAPVPTLDPLPVPVESCDLIISALELHWANDPVGQLIQMRRALRPDGLMLAAMFGGQTLHELRASLAEAEAEITGGLSPRIAPMAEIRDLGALLQRAGFALPVADSERLTVSYADPIALMKDLRRMGETNVMTARRRVAMRRDVLSRACEIYAASFGTSDGRIPATFEIVFLTGWAPHESQQKPLRPGSAQARLADALGTTEISTGDKAPGGTARDD